MQDELIKLFVKDTNHSVISQLPGISSAVAKVKSGSEWSIAFVVKAKHNVDSEGVLYPKLVIQKSAGKNEQIFLLITNKDEKIWVYPDKVFVGETEVYNRDMFLDPKSPTDEEAQMLRMSKGSDLDILMKKFGRFPGRILERVMSGMFVEEYVSANKEKVIVLIS
ncbi:TPA: hypothetical protein QCH88_004387 [Enterobacter asburiae]|nr:hypothetical protein [Cronobacter phage EspYZU08]WAK43657.1 hypothetical protein EspYZU15_157 [Cronobacter phage EspYZU15]WAK45563.1 hypothetical protein EspYZU14_159 [Cronobacter phage EspYZU14]HDR2377140.1 hypothetical protein [Enterobacter asburiae]